MTENECRKLLALCATYWPHQPMPEAALVGWMDLLGERDPKAIHDAIRAHAAEGEKFPPAPGEVLSKLVDRATTGPDFDQVIDEIRLKMRELNREHRFDSSPIFQFHAVEPDEWSDPRIADLVRRSGGINVWRECLGSWLSGADDTTFLAQQRRVWVAMSQRRSEHARNVAIGASSPPHLAEGPQRVGDLVRAALPPEAAGEAQATAGSAS